MKYGSSPSHRRLVAAALPPRASSAAHRRAHRAREGGGRRAESGAHGERRASRGDAPGEVNSDRQRPCARWTTSKPILLRVAVPQCASTLEYQDAQLEAAFEKDMCDRTSFPAGCHALVALAAFLLRQCRRAFSSSSFAEGPALLLAPQACCALFLAYTLLVHSLHRRPATHYWARLALRLWLLLLAPTEAGAGSSACGDGWGACATSCYALLVLPLLCPQPHKWNPPALLVQVGAWLTAGLPAEPQAACGARGTELPAQPHAAAGLAQLTPAAAPRPPRPAAAAARAAGAGRFPPAAGQEPGAVHLWSAGLARL